MAVMTTMRNKMHAVLWAVLALFILSMTVGGLVGGADIIDQLFNRADPTKVIARVNDQDVSPQYFNQLVSQNLDNIRNSGQQITDRHIEQARAQAWDNLIREILVAQEVEKLNLTASDKEVVFHLQNNPPPFLQNNPSFMTDGVFDYGKYQEAIQNPQGNEWAPIESFMKNNYLPNYKLQQYLTASVVATAEDVKDEFAHKNLNYTINGVHVTNQAVSKLAEKPSPNEIENYYKENSSDFERGQLRNLRLVSWAKDASKEDSLRLFEMAKTVYAKANSGNDFSELANEFSQDPGSQNKGGDLGWFEKGRMVKPFEEAAFLAKKGSIVGPVESRFGYHIIWVKDKKTEDGKDKVNAAHILLKYEVSAMTLDKLKQASTLFTYDAQDEGFDVAVDSHQVAPIRADNIKEDASFLPQIGSLRSAVRFAFDNPIHTVSSVYETDRHFAVVIADSVIKAGVAPLSEVEANITRILSTQKENELAKSKAGEILIEATTNKSFANMMKNQKEFDKVNKETNTLDNGFTSIGRSNYVTGALLQATPGDIIGPIETQRGYAIIELLEVSDFDSASFVIQKDKLFTDLLTRKQNQFFQAWLGELKNNAEIIDNRKYYF
ncbi:MAG: hypothetical protein HOL27_02590 [Candidatus Marinimicrobia bacterium]|nr:hypothetical protein [Candidatus Neomarinimicrobiota bacterium]